MTDLNIERSTGPLPPLDPVVEPARDDSAPTSANHFEFDHEVSYEEQDQLFGIQPIYPAEFDFSEMTGEDPNHNGIHKMEELRDNVTGRLNVLVLEMHKLNPVAAQKMVGFLATLQQYARQEQGVAAMLVSSPNRPALGWNMPRLNERPVFIGVSGQENFDKVRAIFEREVGSANEFMNLIQQSDDARGYRIEAVQDATGVDSRLADLLTSWHRVRCTDSSHDIVSVPADSLQYRSSTPAEQLPPSVLAMEIAEIEGADQISLLAEFRTLAVEEFLLTRHDKAAVTISDLADKVVPDVASLRYTLLQVAAPSGAVGSDLVVGVIMPHPASPRALGSGAVLSKLGVLWPRVAESNAMFEAFAKAKLQGQSGSDTVPSDNKQHLLLAGIAGFIGGRVTS